MTTVTANPGELFGAKASRSNSYVSRLRREAPMWIGGIFLLLSLIWLGLHSQINLLCAVMIFGSLLLVSISSRTTAALLTLAYLILMGDIRRAISAFAGQTPFDVLLLIGPAMALVLGLPALLSARLNDALSKAMLLLLVIMTLEIFNPKQGGLTIGLSGAIFYIAPMFWFWIGRELGGTQTLGRLLYGVIFPLALLACLLGLAQTFIGFLPFEKAWIDTASKTYTALHVGGSIRAFGFSVSGAEYATLLTLAAAAIAASAIAGRSHWAVVFPLLVAGIVLSSGRTLLIKLIVAVTCAWTLRRGGKINFLQTIRAGFLIVLALSVIMLAASKFSGQYSTGGSSAVQDALAHESGGLSHPLDERYSTVGVHSTLLINGVVQGFLYPLGHGLGATTLAASKFGADTNTGSSEIDFSDLFISLGLLGGITYCYVIVKVLREAFRYIHDAKRCISLPVFAILVCTAGGWLIGGQYSTSCIAFFLAGALIHSTGTTSCNFKKTYQTKQLAPIS